MPDICMCRGRECPLRDDCYRFTAKPNPYRQAYFMEAPYDPLRDECDFFYKELKRPRTEDTENDDKGEY